MKVFNDYTNWNMDVIDKKKSLISKILRTPSPPEKKTKQTKLIIRELSYQEYNQIAIIYFV